MVAELLRKAQEESQVGRSSWPLFFMTLFLRNLPPPRADACCSELCCERYILKKSLLWTHIPLLYAGRWQVNLSQRASDIEAKQRQMTELRAVIDG